MVDTKQLEKIMDSLFKHDVFIVWKPEYNLGIHVVDEQHRGIVTIINSLYYGMQNKHADHLLMPVYEMVHEYTRIHFEIEEDFLKKCGYPKLEEHKKLHNELITKLAKVGRESLHLHDSNEFLNFLKEWWIDHICDKDREFLNYLEKTQK